ncbi:recombinase family protein [Gluconacetobacter asukensis]|uniref:Recombinase family protein n=1 Tax=Gluconacetobacter asukensis TaxID=1017181 RepID=A0A7W4J0F8_9PROT|nr:recombinase family protein [Gluconacetobacter asukensis]MBB2172386.1 recombinase family protein [Gluconacetobacter asukensis]
MTRVALYARYSSDHQRDASIEDQLRLCREHATKQGWSIVDSYTDRAISGASLLLRPGIQELVQDAQRSRFTIVLAEAMDRLSRDQEDIAGLHKRMAFAGVRIVTLSEGDVTHLHVGLKGTMNALFLKDLADKVRRGLRGRIEDGKSGGGNSYGYDVVRQIDDRGEPIRGNRSINDAEAAIVRRIFHEFANGRSPKRIAVALNDDGISAPTGGDWGFTTINGNRQRGTGILNNEMYIGRLVWNRLRYLKDPETGKRVSRPNPTDDWVIQEVPELRIIDQALWDKVKATQKAIKIDRDTGDTNRLHERQRGKYLFTGLTKCGCCGGGYSMVSGTLVGCSTARNKGTCGNRMNIRRDALESRVLTALKTHLMDPELFAVFCDEFTRRMNEQRIEASAGISAAKAELQRVEREFDTLMDALLKGTLPEERIKERSQKLERRKAQAEETLATIDEPPPVLHPSMAVVYRERVTALHNALQQDTTRLEAADLIRSLIERIVLTPVDGALRVELHGDLAGILTIAAGAKQKSPTVAGSGSVLASQVKMVAGEGNQRYLRLVTRGIPRVAA